MTSVAEEGECSVPTGSGLAHDRRAEYGAIEVFDGVLFLSVSWLSEPAGCKGEVSEYDCRWPDLSISIAT